MTSQTCVQFTSERLVVSESCGTAVLTVERLNSQSECSVVYETIPLTAHAGDDYTHSTGLLIFRPGVSARQVKIPIFNDEAAEDSEIFACQLKEPSNTTLGIRAFCVITIIDDDGGDPVVGVLPESRGISVPPGARVATVTISQPTMCRRTARDAIACGRQRRGCASTCSRVETLVLCEGCALWSWGAA